MARETSTDSRKRMTTLGRTDLEVSAICLGGNVFGWTADESQSWAILAAYTAAGGNFIDTANSYLIERGRSETIIGRWIAARAHREQVVLATKVGGGQEPVRNLRAKTIEREAQASLERLQTDRIDLYYAHFDDEGTPLEESLRAFDALVRAGTVRYIAASNYTPERLTAALELQREHGLAEFMVLQPHYNFVERGFERTLLPVAEAWDLAVLPYYPLAKGFLTGKYRPGGRGRRICARRGRARLPRQPRHRRARGARRGRGGSRDDRGCRRARMVACPAAGRRPDRQRSNHQAARGDHAGRHAGADPRGGRATVNHHSAGVNATRLSAR